MESPRINKDGLEYDTPSWRAQRNEKLREWIENEQAVQFVLIYADICEVWDDLIDKDKPIHDDDINRAFLQALVALPANDFFVAHRHQMLPLMVSGINAWMDSTTYEKGGSDHQRVFSYVLRDWYMELVSMVIYITRGWSYLRDVSIEVREFFTHHETLDQYMERFK